MTIKQEYESVYRERLEKLREENTLEECVVLSCGPSLSLYSENQIVDFCRDKFVIAIKLAYLKYRDITHVAMSNGCNLPYSETGVFYNFGNTFSILSSNFPKHIVLANQPCDVFLQVTNPFPTGCRREDFLCFTKDFDNHTLEKTLYRKCFPGIMGESCIPFIHYMRFKKFYTVGWDLINGAVNSENYKHFWDDHVKQLSHQANPGALPWDNIANIEASTSLYEWLLKNGVSWSIIGNSALSDKIPRYTL